MKRALFLLAVPAAAIAVAVLGHRAPEPKATAGAPQSAAAPPVRTGESTWVTTAPGARRTEPGPERTAPPGHPPGPKPATDSRTALMGSHVPALAVASLDQVESPRQRLLAQTRGPSEARLAQVERLSDRSQSALTRLKAARADARGEERARIDRAIHAIERNQSFRTRIIAGRTPPPSGRAGTGEGPVPQFVKAPR